MLERDIDYEAADEGHGDRSGHPQHVLRSLGVCHLPISAVGQVTWKAARGLDRGSREGVRGEWALL